MRCTRVRGVTTLVLFVVALGAASAESLWSPSFRGYLSGSRSLAIGQSLLVQIDASSSLSFASSTTDSKNLTLDFTGGQYGNLFSFLPQVRTGGALSTTGKDSLSLKTQVPVVVTAVNPDGSATVQGTRTVAIQGKNESITITGTVPQGQLGQAGAINFSQLANARLSYTTFLASSTNVLSPADLQQILAAPRPRRQRPPRQPVPHRWPRLLLVRPPRRLQRPPLPLHPRRSRASPYRTRANASSCCCT